MISYLSLNRKYLTNEATINPVVNAAISVWVAPKPAVAKKKTIPQKKIPFG